MYMHVNSNAVNKDAALTSLHNFKCVSNALNNNLMPTFKAGKPVKVKRLAINTCAGTIACRLMKPLTLRRVNNRVPTF